MFYFFFSSRRRHTSSKRDWSSDVCSSDLVKPEMHQSVVELGTEICSDPRCARQRSEERRVGKECRSRGSPYHQKKKGESNDKTRARIEEIKQVLSQFDYKRKD